MKSELQKKTEVTSLHKLQAILYTASISGTRACFLAGFAYYRIGRYNFESANDDAYIVFITWAFTFAVLSAGFAAILSYYSLRYVHANETKRNEYVIKIAPFSRIVFQLYVLGLLLYILGLSRTGFVYYSFSNDKYIVFWMFLITCIAMIIGIYGYISVRYARYMSTADREGSLSSSPFASDFGMKLKQQCDLIAGKAVYISGLAQTGLLHGTRYNPHEQNKYSSLASMFLFFSCLATATAILSSSFLSVISIFINDTPESKRGSVCNLFEPLARTSFFLYGSSFVSIAIMIILMPFGCHYPQQSTFGLVCGLSSLLLMAFVSYHTYNSFKSAELSSSKSSIDDSESLLFSERKITEEKENQRILSQINNTGLQATLASGFVFYNVCTHNVDVLKINDNVVITGLFLFMNVFTVSTGLLSAVFSSILSFSSTLCNSYHCRFQFLQRTRMTQTLITINFYLSLGGWFILFGILGFTKYGAHSYIPVSCAAIFGILTMIGGVYLDSAQNWAFVIVKAMHDNINMTISTPNKNKYCSEMAELLNNIAFKVLFLGGFSYNAALFFSFQQQDFDRYYLLFMCISFTSSLTFVSWAAFYNNCMYDCTTEDLQVEFAHQTYMFYKIAVSMVKIVVIFLILGFSLTGTVKNHTFYHDWKLYFPVMATTSIFTLILILISLRSTRHYFTIANKSSTYTDTITNPLTSTNTSTSFSTDTTKKIKTPTDGAYVSKQIIEQIEISSKSASFVAGNVCYEILFTKMLSKPVYNYNYLIAANWIFLAGMITVCYASQVRYFLGECKSSEKKEHFIREIRKKKGRVFALSISMYLSWLYSIIFIGKVEYAAQHDNYYIPAIFGSLGIFVFLCVLGRIKSIAVEFEKDNDNVNNDEHYKLDVNKSSSSSSSNICMAEIYRKDNDSDDNHLELDVYNPSQSLSSDISVIEMKQDNNDEHYKLDIHNSSSSSSSNICMAEIYRKDNDSDDNHHELDVYNPSHSLSSNIYVVEMKQET